MTNIRNVDLNLLIALDVLIEEKSVSKAAKRLRLTQPTVSGMLVRLRELYDDPLFVRVHRGIMPTPFCETLQPFLKQWIQSTKQIVSHDALDRITKTLKYTIAAQDDYLQMIVLAPFLKIIRQTAPNVQIAIIPMPTERFEKDFTNGNIDLAVGYKEFMPTDFYTRVLHRETHVGMVRAKHPHKGKSISVKELCRYKHVIVSPTPGYFYGPMDKALSQVDAKRTIMISVPSFASLEMVLETDDLIAVVPKRFLKLTGNKVREIALPVKIEGFETTVGWHTRTNNDSFHRHMRETLFSVSALR